MKKKDYTDIFFGFVLLFPRILADNIILRFSKSIVYLREDPLTYDYLSKM